MGGRSRSPSLIASQVEPQMPAKATQTMKAIRRRGPGAFRYQVPGLPIGSTDLSQAAKLGHLQRRHRHYQQGSHPSQYDRRHRAKEPGRHTGLESADLVGAADEDRVDRGHPAEQVLGRQDLEQRARTTTLTVSTMPLTPGEPARARSSATLRTRSSRPRTAPRSRRVRPARRRGGR